MGLSNLLQAMLGLCFMWGVGFIAGLTVMGNNTYLPLAYIMALPAGFLVGWNVE